MIDSVIIYLSGLGLPNQLIPSLAVLTIFIALIIGCLLINFILDKIFFQLIRKSLRRSSKTVFAKALVEQSVFRKLAHLASGGLFYFGSNLLYSAQYPWSSNLVHGIKVVVIAYLIIMLARLFSAILDGIYSHLKSSQKQRKQPIRIYFQVAKIAAWLISGIFIVSVIIDQSPWTFLASLGALSAVLILVFRDTLLGFTTSIQASVYDIARVGDWITIPRYNIDGDVLDISINTVKVRNFDHTIVSIPTANLLTTGVQNWRGMSLSGGRRIKRHIAIDIDSIKFSDHELIAKLKQLDYMRTYIDQVEEDIRQHNNGHNSNSECILNGRQLTNIGLFRQYAKSYLLSNANIHHNDGFTFIIRQLQPTTMGLPLEVYVFTTDTDWKHYEEIQADIFDHLLAALPFFGLKAFQAMSNNKMTNMTA